MENRHYVRKVLQFQMCPTICILISVNCIFRHNSICFMLCLLVIYRKGHVLSRSLTKFMWLCRHFCMSSKNTPSISYICTSHKLLKLFCIKVTLFHFSMSVTFVFSWTRWYSPTWTIMMPRHACIICKHWNHLILCDITKKNSKIGYTYVY